MGIDIYARWRGQTEDERNAQTSVWLSAGEGEVGYLREAYHGSPYATVFLCVEAFAANGGQERIPAATLRRRLSKALMLVEERERTIYHSSDKDIEQMKKSYRDFVSLCERKEKETGQSVLIVASY